MIKELLKLATELDRSGNISEANKVDFLLRKYAQATTQSSIPQPMATSVAAEPTPEQVMKMQENGVYRLKVRDGSPKRIGEFDAKSIIPAVQKYLSENKDKQLASSSFYIEIYNPDRYTPGKIDDMQIQLKDFTQIRQYLNGAKLPFSDIVPAAEVQGYVNGMYKGMVFPYVKGCIQQAANRHILSGEVKINYTVNTSGFSQNISVIVPEGEEQLKQCIISKIEKATTRQLETPYNVVVSISLGG